MFLITFVKNVISEMRLVEWLKLDRTIRYTVLVISFIIFFTLCIALLDQGFFELRNLVLTNK